MPVHVHLPIRLRIDAETLDAADDPIREALDAGVRRALQRTASEVLTPRGGYLGTRIHAPTVSWREGSLAALSPGQRDRIEQLVREVIVRAAAEGALADHAARHRGVRAPLSARAAERFDRARLASFGLYGVPSYDDGGSTRHLPIDTDGPGDAAQATTHSVGRWIVQRRGWFAAKSSTDLEDLEGKYFGFWFMQEDTGGPKGLIWRQSDPNQPIGFYVRGLDGRAWKYQEFWAGLYRNRKRVSPSPGTYDYASVFYMPEAAPTRAEWVSAEQLRARIRADVDVDLSGIAWPETADTQTILAARQILFDKEYADRSRALDGVSDALLLSIGDDSHAYAMPADVARWSGIAYLAPIATLHEEKFDPNAKDAGSGTGSTDAETPSTDGAGAGEGEGEGATGGGFVYGDDARTPNQSGSALPGSAGGAAPASYDAPFEDEPSLDALPEDDARRLRAMIADIARRLQIAPGKFAGSFCLAAADTLGRRARSVLDYAQAEPHGYMLRDPSPNRSISGAVDFRPVVSPAVQLLRHLADVVHRVTALSHAIQQVYDRNAHLIGGFRHNASTGWLIDFGSELHGILKRSVASHFVFSTSVVFMQLLHTSKRNIEARRSKEVFENYAAFFEQVVAADLMGEQRLEDLRAQLVFLTGTGSAGRDLARGVIDTWRGARGALLDTLQGRNPFAGIGAGASGEIVLGEHGIQGIRDDQGVIWTLAQLDRAIASRRDGVVQVDPLARQLTADPRIRARFTRNPGGIRKELAVLLEEMAAANDHVTERVRADPDYAFSLAPLDDDFSAKNPQTIPGTGFVLHGVHALAHETVGAFFRGDIYYLFGVGDALKFRQSRDTALGMLEIGTIVLVSIVCAPAGLAVGAAWSVYHEVVAEHHMEGYRALIDPDRVFDYAQLEAELFAADLGVALSFIPLGRYAGRVAVGAGRQLLMGEVRAAGRYAVRHVSKTLALATVQALRQDLLYAFVTHVAQFEVMGRVMGLMLEPVIAEMQREQLTLEQLLALAAEVEPA